MKAKTKRKAIPKYFLGTLLSTGIGLASSAIQTNKAAKAQKLAEKRATKAKYAEELNRDTFEAEQYQDDIANSIMSYYKRGGKLAMPPISSTKGGKLKPISSDMVIAKGNKHEETKIDNTSGIKLMQGNEPVAEIEDDETIKDGVKVYSDRLKAKGNKTYAEVAENLAKKKAKIEKDINKKDLITNNTNKRKLELLDKEEDMLFAKQENSKKPVNTSKANIPNAKFGDFLKDLFTKGTKTNTTATKIADNVMPFVDNIGNAIITAKTPKIPGPTLDRIKDNKTTVNVNPQLAAIDNSVASTTEFIKNNTSNSNTARENIASAKIKGANAKANILANKENTETQLTNANNAQVRNTMARNNAKIDANNMQQVARANDIGARVSANLANVAGDYIDKRNFDAVKDYQDEQLDILKHSGDSGVSRRMQLSNSKEVELMKANPEKYYYLFKGTPEEKQFLNLTGYNPFAKNFTMKDVTQKFANIPSNINTVLT